MEHGSCSESCVTSFNYESEIVDIKVEGDTHVEVVQKPIPITFPTIKPETEECECTHSGEQPYCCDVCSNSCSRKFELKIHQQKHTGARPYQCDHNLVKWLLNIVCPSYR